MTILTEKPTLYVLANNNDWLKKHGESFQIRDTKSGELKTTLPALSIRDIMIFGKLVIDAEVFDLAEKNLVPIHFLGGNYKLRGSIVYDFTKNVFLRSEQFKFHFDENKKFFLARKFVLAKIQNQNIVLQKMRVKTRIDNDLSHIKNLEQLRGFEGSSARQYFQAWQNENIIKINDLKFVGRKKFPATDQINSLLSFCFTLFHGELHTQLLIAGLDPFVGFLHEQSYGHAALASDFIEIFRGPIEHFVLKILNRKELDIKEDFEKESSGLVRLSKSGFQKFFPKWIDFLRKDKFFGEKNLTQTIERDIRKFVHFLNGDEVDFSPFIWGK
jgi:CRISPR-associated protein Cas1